ncbi:endo-1,3(4)-beta-glucanase 1-like, partial [Anneissia japonica]|uniref:endo-1,3(4)-beta-glucanase 1-like n=1 Tax=Anneissia japonica TaxID=1529436 RepID=UPI001425B264
DILTAIEKDAANHTLDQDCVNEGAQSYWAGKSIGMVARLASISRAFGTDHYTKLDESLRKCLDLWLGIVDGITEPNKFRYDTVWGGMFLSSIRPNELIFPWTNFGFVSYADHHFHLGYWIYAISYYAQYHKDWAMKDDNYERIVALVRDVASPSKIDTFFPTV